MLQIAWDWKMGDPDNGFTTLQLNMILWSTTTKLANVVELTVPWENNVA